MKNLFTRLFCLLLILAFNIDIVSAQQPGKRGGNANNFFATDFFGGQNAHLQSGNFGDLFNGSRWIGIGQPFVPSGDEFYGLRIQDREYQGAFSWNAQNGNNAAKNLEITWGFTEPIGTTIKPSLNFNFAESATQSDTRMTLTAGGTLGIGTANPNQSFTLDVVGKTRCTLGTWSASDKRYKEDFQEITNAADKLSQLTGLSYKFKNEVINGVDFSQENVRRDIGFIAQDLEKVFPDLVIKDEAGYYSVRYEGLIPVLVEGFNDQQVLIEEQGELITEQTNLINSQTVLINDQESTILALTNKMENMEQQLSAVLTALQNLDTEATLNITPGQTDNALGQNRPNPFKGQTTIDYTLPLNVSTAALTVYNIEGKLIKSFNLNDRQGTVNFDGSNLSAGTYFYSLNSNGKKLAQQKMIIQ